MLAFIIRFNFNKMEIPYNYSDSYKGLKAIAEATKGEGSSLEA